MDYKSEIYKMVENINDEKLLIKIYTFVTAWIQKREDTSIKEMPPPLKRE